MEEIVINERKENAKKWLKNKYNLALLLILLLTIGTRFYYFDLATSQPLWWDEAVYGSLAMNHVHGIQGLEPLILGETEIRPPFLSFMWSILLKFGIGESGVRFLLQFTASVLSVFFVYLIGKEVYSRKIGLISAAIFSVLWIHLFYTARLLTGVPALVFLYASVYLFIKSTGEKFNPFYFASSLFLLSLSTLTRYPNGIVFFAYLAFLVVTLKFDLLKKKSFYIAGILGLVPIFIFFGLNFISQGSIFPALLGGEYLNPREISERPTAYYVLNFIPLYLKTPFYLFFILGLVGITAELALGYDVIKTKKRLRGHLINLLLLLSVLILFIYVARGAEDRYLFPIVAPLVMFAAIGINYVSRIFKKQHKYFSLLFIIAVLAIGAYQQLTFADQIIVGKKSSFLQMKQGFEWIEANAPADSVIIGSGITAYGMYYSPTKRIYDLPYKDLPESIEGIGELIDDLDSDYLIVHAFTPPEPYTNEYLAKFRDKWQPAQAYFADSARTQPILIIYKRVDKVPFTENLQQ